MLQLTQAFAALVTLAMRLSKHWLHWQCACSNNQTLVTLACPNIQIIGYIGNAPVQTTNNWLHWLSSFPNNHTYWLHLIDLPIQTTICWSHWIDPRVQTTKYWLLCLSFACANNKILVTLDRSACTNKQTLVTLPIHCLCKLLPTVQTSKTKTNPAISFL